MFIYNKSMNELSILGKAIKGKRLSLNLRMDDVAEKADITRATLWSIEKGKGGFSAASLFKVMSILDLSFNVTNANSQSSKRGRASRINTSFDKKVNRFIVMCVEQYANSVNQGSGLTYKRMLQKGIIDELKNDYEDLHGMSFTSLNEYIDSLMEDN